MANQTSKKIIQQLTIYIFVFFLILVSIVNAKGATFNVKQFGAKGDGLTDDTKAIRNAFSKAIVSGGTVYFPQGKYLTDIIDIRPAKAVNIMVAGLAGKTTVIKKYDDKVDVALFFCEVPSTVLTFRDLILDGSKSKKVRKWKLVKDGVADVDEAINGIFAYNVNRLTVTNCTVRNFHGRGIACYNSNKLLATRNHITNVSGSGIIGHRVKLVNVANCSVENTGYIDEEFILNDKKTSKKSSFPKTTFGDGIEGECDTLIATNNRIINPGRCGIVHDLARDLGYINSIAIVTANTITVNSYNVNNDNPPTGMWFEQSNTVKVSNNILSLLKSKSPLVSGIRFYGVTGSINCTNNTINAEKYTTVSNEAIGIFEPSLQTASIVKNKLKGRFKNAISISYGNNEAKILKLTITDNLFEGEQQGIAISIDSKKSFPAVTQIYRNTIGMEREKSYSFSHYGNAVTETADRSIFYIKDNRIRGVIENYLPKVVPGIKFTN